MAVCSTPGCPTLVARGYCEKHHKERRRQSDQRRPDATARGYDRKHRADRKAYFAQHPLCQDPSGCIAPATDLDHIDGNPFNRDWSNYRGLCGHHHKLRTARDQPGGWNAR